MSSFDGDIPVRLAMSIATGSIRAATPMLFMKADSTPAVIMMTMMRRISPWPDMPRTC